MTVNGGSQINIQETYERCKTVNSNLSVESATTKRSVIEDDVSVDRVCLQEVERACRWLSSRVTGKMNFEYVCENASALGHERAPVRCSQFSEYVWVVDECEHV